MIPEVKFNIGVHVKMISAWNLDVCCCCHKESIAQATLVVTLLIFPIDRKLLPQQHIPKLAILFATVCNITCMLDELIYVAMNVVVSSNGMTDNVVGKGSKLDIQACNVNSISHAGQVQVATRQFSLLLLLCIM